MEKSVEFRKVQVTGGSTYIISLPKKWIKKVELKPKDQVALIPQPDLSLRLIPNREMKTKEVTDSFLDASQIKRPESVLTEFIAYYLVGYDNIHIKLKDPMTRGFLRNSIHQKLIGVEIMEENANEIIAQCLLGSVEIPLDKALRRMHILMTFMFKDAIQALRTNDQALAQEIVRRDDEVDRLYLLIVRQLKAAVENRLQIEEIGLSSQRDCLGYRLIVKSVERSADHAARIAKTVLTFTEIFESKIAESLFAVSKLATEIQESSMNVLYKYDAEAVYETMAKIKDITKLEEKIIEQLLEYKLDIQTTIGIRLILESIRRIAEYGTDITEIAINLHVKSPS
jgi:phosphate uptake regulator